MELAVIIVFCLAVNLDGLIVGLSYGMQNIALPVMSVVIVSLISGMVLFASMVAGKFLATAIPNEMIVFFAAFLLAFMGIWRIISVRRKQLKNEGLRKELYILFSFQIPLLHIAVQILQTPARADINKDGTVDTSDAFMLGVALALDSLTAGFGVALAGFSPLITSIVAVICCLGCLSFSVNIGRCFQRVISGSRHALLNGIAAYSSGIVLLLLAIWRLLA